MKLIAKILNELNTPAMVWQLGWLALGLEVLVLALRPFAFPSETYLWGGDYNTFWAASWLAQHGQLAQLYGTRMLESIPTLGVPVPPWFYPPPMLLLVYPAAFAPFVGSYIVFVGLGLLLAAAVWRLSGLSKLQLLLLLAAPAAFINILYGQNGLITAALWTGGLLLLPRRPLLAGSLLGLLVIKPQLALIAPLLLLFDRQGRALAGFILSATALSALSWLAFGPDVWRDFIANLSAVSELMRTGTLVDVTKIGSLYIAARANGAGHTEALIMQIMLAAMALANALYLWHSRKVSPDLKAAIALLTVLLITPYQFIYDLTLVLGALAFWYRANGQSWAGADRLAAWLLWLSPLLAQGLASSFHVFCLPAILILALWQITIAALAQHRQA